MAQIIGRECGQWGVQSLPSAAYLTDVSFDGGYNSGYDPGTYSSGSVMMGGSQLDGGDAVPGGHPGGRRSFITRMDRAGVRSASNVVEQKGSKNTDIARRVSASEHSTRASGSSNDSRDLPVASTRGGGSSDDSFDPPESSDVSTSSDSSQRSATRRGSSMLGTLAEHMATRNPNEPCRSTQKIANIPRRCGRDEPVAASDAVGFGGAYDFRYLPLGLPPGLEWPQAPVVPSPRFVPPPRRAHAAAPAGVPSYVAAPAPAPPPGLPAQPPPRRTHAAAPAGVPGATIDFAIDYGYSKIARTQCACSMEADRLPNDGARDPCAMRDDSPQAFWTTCAPPQRRVSEVRGMNTNSVNVNGVNLLEAAPWPAFVPPSRRAHAAVPARVPSATIDSAIDYGYNNIAWTQRACSMEADRLPNDGARDPGAMRDDSSQAFWTTRAQPQRRVSEAPGTNTSGANVNGVNRSPPRFGHRIDLGAGTQASGRQAAQAAHHGRGAFRAASPPATSNAATKKPAGALRSAATAAAAEPIEDEVPWPRFAQFASAPCAQDQGATNGLQCRTSSAVNSAVDGMKTSQGDLPCGVCIDLGFLARRA